MPIWRLAPQDPAASVWHASARRVQVLVRAQSVQEALCLGRVIFTTHLARPGAHTRPWPSEARVVCEHVVQSGYPEHGAAAILEVTGYEDAQDA
jgi:hypothetical protein